MDSPPHQLINLGLPKAPDLREIVDAYHDVCGDLVAKMPGKLPFTTDTLRKLTTTTEVSVERMRACFPDKEFGSFEAYLSECKRWYMQD